MQLTQEELKAYLMETDEQFKRLSVQHSEFKRQLEELHSRAHLSEQDLLEEVRIKKLKLRLKDQMQEMMDRYRTEHQPV
jgi:uncharacterized protein